MTVQKISNLTDCLIWSLQKYNTAIISASPSRDHNINIVSVISMVGVTIHVTGYWRWWTKHDADQSYGYTSSSGWTRCKIRGKPDKKWYKASSYWHCFFIIVQIKLAIVKIKTLKFFKIIFLWAIYMTSSCFEGIVYQSNDYDNYMLMINYILGLTGTLNVKCYVVKKFYLWFRVEHALSMVMFDDEFKTKKNTIQTTTFAYPFDLVVVNTEVWMINLFFYLNWIPDVTLLVKP